MGDSNLRQLLGTAERAYGSSYAPYSNVHVGAALVAADGTVFTGCNMEVLNMSGSICAERGALANAIANGKRTFSHVAVKSDKIQNCWPCGVCREVLAEFGSMTVIVESGDGSIVTAELHDLIPHHLK